MISILFHTQKRHAYNPDRRPTALTELSSLNFTGHFIQDFSDAELHLWFRYWRVGKASRAWGHEMCDNVRACRLRMLIRPGGELYSAT
jgi:hypothetical protein